jgi:TonB family protein
MTAHRHRRTSVERFLLHLYELTLCALPRHIRRRWAAEMTAMFGERLREATASGGAPAALAAGGRELGSIAIAAFQSRVGQASGRVHRAHDAQDGSDVWRTDPVPALFPREDRRPLKLATMGALACHFALFLVVFPDSATPDLVVPRRDEPTVLRQMPLPPPPRVETPLPVRHDAPPRPTVEPVLRTPVPIVDPEEVYRPETPVEIAPSAFDVGLPEQPPAPPADRVRAGLDIRLPRLLERVEPEYPRLALRAGIECVVVLEAVIGKTGSVADATVIRGCRLGLDDAALDAVQQWQFEPSWYNGRPVEVVATFTVRFRIH